MTTSKRTVYSFVSKNGKHFTTDINQALTVEGHKVLAPGVTFAISRMYIENQQKIWDNLLDLMETLYATEEGDEYEYGRKLIAEKIEGLQEALSLLNYGSTDTEPMRLIMARAEIMYDEGV